MIDAFSPCVLESSPRNRLDTVLIILLVFKSQIVTSGEATPHF
jgi:hypothetical protein